MGPVGKFLAENGEGLHHISLKVGNYRSAKEHFESKDLRVIGEVGGVMAFVHPKTCKGILVEFTEVT